MIKVNKKVTKSVDTIRDKVYTIGVVRRKQERRHEMEHKEMTDKQFNTYLEMLLHILENEDKEKAIELIKSLLKK